MKWLTLVLLLVGCDNPNFVLADSDSQACKVGSFRVVDLSFKTTAYECVRKSILTHNRFVLYSKWVEVAEEKEIIK